MVVGYRGLFACDSADSVTVGNMVIATPVTGYCYSGSVVTSPHKRLGDNVTTEPEYEHPVA